MSRPQAGMSGVWSSESRLYWMYKCQETCTGEMRQEFPSFLSKVKHASRDVHDDHASKPPAAEPAPWYAALHHCSSSLRGPEELPRSCNASPYHL